MPYVYMSVEKTTGKIYIGYRYKNKVPSSDDFGIHYFTSNKYVKENFNNFDHCILAEFFTKKDAYKFESDTIKSFDNDVLINKDRIRKMPKSYRKKEPFVREIRKCALDDCNNTHTSWRYKCCCISHQKKYAAKRSRKS